MDTYGKSILITILVAVHSALCLGQTYHINCYSKGDDDAQYYGIYTKTIDLDSKNIINESFLSNEGELINIKPIPINEFNNNILLTAIDIGCYCKNSGPESTRTNIFFINAITGNVLNIQRLINYTCYNFLQAGPNRIFLTASGRSDNFPDMRGIYRLGNGYNISREGNAPLGFTPGSLDSLNVFSFPRHIFDHLYYDSYNGYYYVLKTDNDGLILTDSLKCLPVKSSDHIFAARDSLLYIFNLNYEIHSKGEVIKGYGDDWIESNLKIYNATEFSLIDSIPIPDYEEGDYISGSSGVGDIIDDYIVYYFGESNDLELFAPAMLFIFDTRTNEASWLRVGWR